MLRNAIFSTLQGTQNPDIKQALQRAKNTNAPSQRTTQLTEISWTSIQIWARQFSSTTQ